MRILIALSALLAAGAFLSILLDPTVGRVWPDYRQIAEIAVWHGREIGARDLIDSMELRAGGEFRPRFLAYAIQSIDVKLRLALYPYLLVHPAVAPVAWAVQLLGVLLLYRTLVNLTAPDRSSIGQEKVSLRFCASCRFDGRWAALAAVAIYVSSMGFLSGFVMGLLQGKAVANASILISLWLASEAAQRLKPGDLLIAAPWPWLVALGLSLLAGFWIDEQPIYAFALVPLVFWERFVRSASRAPLHGDDVRPLRRETVRVGDVARRCGQDEILASRHLLSLLVTRLQVFHGDPKHLLVCHLLPLLAGLAALLIVLIQLNNFWHVHAGWQRTHASLAAVYPWYRVEVPLDPDKPYEAAELQAIWTAWRAGGLEDYLATHTVSLGAAYLVFDLRLVDGPRHPGRGAGM